MERACRVCGRAGADGAVLEVSYIKGKRVQRNTCSSCRSKARRIEGRPESGTLLVALGDTHFPFHSGPALDWAIGLIGKLKPRHVVQLGDLYDRLSQSRFPRNHSVITPQEELERGVEMANFMWARVREASPESECHQIMGNHDERPIKRILEKAPELLDFVLPSVRGLHTFEGVRTVHDPAEELILGGVVLQHGWASHSKAGYHASRNTASTVHGHTHRGGTWFRNDSRGYIWELDAGCLVDATHPAFGYRMSNRFDGVTLGVGVVTIDGGATAPAFVPFPGAAR